MGKKITKKRKADVCNTFNNEDKKKKNCAQTSPNVPWQTEGPPLVNPDLGKGSLEFLPTARGQVG